MCLLFLIVRTFRICLRAYQGAPFRDTVAPSKVSSTCAGRFFIKRHLVHEGLRCAGAINHRTMPPKGTSRGGGRGRGRPIKEARRTLYKLDMGIYRIR